MPKVLTKSADNDSMMKFIILIENYVNESNVDMTRFANLSLQKKLWHVCRVRQVDRKELISRLWKESQ